MRARLIKGGQEIELDGEVYTHTLASLHLALKPRCYFEIGTLHGDTLRLASCPSVAVDPSFQIRGDVRGAKPSLQMFEETSDGFFAGHDLTELLGGPVAMAFLDGFHQFDFLLRDFINTERACDPLSLVMLHDCLPGDAAMTGGAEHGGGASRRLRGYWTGDVWKLGPILRRWRPELSVTCLDALPTGLVAVTGLDPTNRVLSDNYDAIVAEWAGVHLADYGLARLFAESKVMSARDWRLQYGPQEAPGEPIGLRRRLRRLVGR